MVPRCVLLDLDGTLVDSRSDLAAAVNRVLADLGRPVLPDERIISFIGHGVDSLLERSLGDAGLVHAARPLFERHYGDGLLDRTQPYPGIDDLVRRLGAKTVVAVVTNKPGRWARAIVDGLGWAGAMTSVVGGGDVAHLKPAPDMAKLVLEKSGRSKVDAVMVGDMEVDLEFARAAGLNSVGVTWGLAGRQRLEAAGADWIVDSAAELERLLQRIPNPCEHREG